MRVLMMPDYRAGNPYQQLLADALGSHQVQVLFPAGYRRVLPLWRACRDASGIDVLHLHWIDPYLRGHSMAIQGLYCLRLLADVALVRASGVRVVWTIHNAASHDSRFPKLERWVQRRLAKQVDRVIVHAQSNLRELREALPLPDRKVSVIPHGHYRKAYGPAMERKAARRELGLPETGRIYLYFGYLRPYKGVEGLVSEWAKSGRGEAGDTLLIAGHAADENYLAQISAASKAAGAVKIIPGFVASEKVPVFFGAADIVVLPFRKILTSGSLMLAMSYGKPIIAPRAGAVAEMLGDADDLLYDPEDPHGLKRCLHKSTSLPLAALSEKVEAACGLPGWEGLAEMTAAAYRQARARWISEVPKHV